MTVPEAVSIVHIGAPDRWAVTTMAFSLGGVSCANAGEDRASPQIAGMRAMRIFRSYRGLTARSVNDRRGVSLRLRM
jgi:RPA family protein